MCDQHAMLYVPAFGRPVDIPAGADVGRILEEHERRAGTEQAGADDDRRTRPPRRSTGGGARRPFRSAA